MTSDTPKPSTATQKLTAATLRSPVANWFLNLPPVAWLTQLVTRRVVSEQLKAGADERLSPPQLAGREYSADVRSVFDSIVQDAVQALDFAGAMLVLYEQGDRLQLRAFYVDPTLLGDTTRLDLWVDQIQSVSESATDGTMGLDLDAARVQANANVQAFQIEQAVIRNDLYSLFVGVVPDHLRGLINGIQGELGIAQVVAVPFFIRGGTNGSGSTEFVGTVAAASTKPITVREVGVLSAFGRQAAAAIESERRRRQVQLTQAVVLKIQASLEDEQAVLQHIADGVVGDLGYLGAMVATYEPDGALPVRAFALDSKIATPQQVTEWEETISRVAGLEISLSNPVVARTYVNRVEYAGNLSVLAVRKGEPVTSDDLYDLFTPVVPPASRPVVRAIQRELGIKQVIAVPFFYTRMVNGRPQREVVGNLFAATRSRRFSAGELEVLNIFGLQAAVGLYNARLYRKSEERRRVAQSFGKMAFSAAAYVHDLRNHVGAFSSYLHVLKLLSQTANGDLTMLMGMLDKMPDYMRRLERAKEILDNLHEPWKEISDEPVNVNQCVLRAIDAVLLSQDKPEAEGVRIVVPQNEMLNPIEHEGERPPKRVVSVNYITAEELPLIITSYDMLTETFRILIKNALEAIVENPRGTGVWVTTRLVDQCIEVEVRDDGVGIRSENLSRIFDLGWSTKKKGMGFGLFWSKDFIEGLGGTIRVESAPGEGATFTLTLPTPGGR